MFTFITRMFSKQKNLAESLESQAAMPCSDNSAGPEEAEAAVIARHARIKYVKMAKCCFK